MLIILGFMRGCISLKDVWKLGRDLGPRKCLRLEFTDLDMPSYPTIINILKAVDPIEFEETCGQIVRLSSRNQFTHIAIDSKSIRGTINTKSGLLHLVSAFVPEISGTLAQRKSEVAGGEVTTAISIIDKLDVTDEVIIADALFAGEKYIEKLLPPEGIIFLNSNKTEGGLGTYHSTNLLSRKQKLTLDLHRLL